MPINPFTSKRKAPPTRSDTFKIGEAELRLTLHALDEPEMLAAFDFREEMEMFYLGNEEAGIEGHDFLPVGGRRVTLSRNLFQQVAILTQQVDKAQDETGADVALDKKGLFDYFVAFSAADKDSPEAEVWQGIKKLSNEVSRLDAKNA